METFWANRPKLEADPAAPYWPDEPERRQARRLLLARLMPPELKAAHRLARWPFAYREFVGELRVHRTRPEGTLGALCQTLAWAVRIYGEAHVDLRNVTAVELPIPAASFYVCLWAGGTQLVSFPATPLDPADSSLVWPPGTLILQPELEALIRAGVLGAWPPLHP